MSLKSRHLFIETIFNTSRLAVGWHLLLRYGGCATSAGLPTNFGNAIQRVHIRDIDVSILDLRGARLPQPPEGPTAVSIKVDLYAIMNA
jgi:hypothetical protein